MAAPKFNHINLQLSPSDVNTTTLFDTECVCTIYSTASECDKETEAYVYGWFFVLLAIIIVLTATIYVVRSIQYLVHFLQDEVHNWNRVFHRQTTTHMH